MSVNDLAVDGTLNTTNQQSVKPDGLCLRKPRYVVFPCLGVRRCVYIICVYVRFFVLISLTNK